MNWKKSFTKVLILSIILLLGGEGCQDRKKEQILDLPPAESSGESLPLSSNPIQSKITIYQVGEYNLTFKNHKLVQYPPKRLYLFFIDGGKYSELEERFLQELGIPYLLVEDPDLDEEFNISIYPTIVILDRNRTIKYEGFTPYEILKAERYFQLNREVISDRE
ncbi:MAG: hypothetical protein ABGW77_05810 [Campylobacterales bacterium]